VGRASPSAVHANRGDTIVAGGFLRLLKELAPDEERRYAAGEKEVKGEIAKTTRGRQGRLAGPNGMHAAGG
jgi:hypothetical protein